MVVLYARQPVVSSTDVARHLHFFFVEVWVYYLHFIINLRFYVNWLVYEIQYGIKAKGPSGRDLAGGF